MRILLAFLFIAHGIAHLPGFVVPWRLATLPGLPYKTSMINGSVQVGGMGIRILGLFWLLGALGFVLTGAATLRGYGYWPTLGVAVTLFSLVLTLLGWPEARIGTVLNLMLLTLILFGARAGWLTAT
jgi:hypothetical protein